MCNYFPIFTVKQDLEPKLVLVTLFSTGGQHTCLPHLGRMFHTSLFCTLSVCYNFLDLFFHIILANYLSTALLACEDWIIRWRIYVLFLRASRHEFWWTHSHLHGLPYRACRICYRSWCSDMLIKNNIGWIYHPGIQNIWLKASDFVPTSEWRVGRVILI